MLKYRLSDISDSVYIQCENKSKTKTCYYIFIRPARNTAPSFTVY